MITALLPPTVLRSNMFRSLQNHIQNNLNIPMKAYPTVPHYTKRWSEATDLITWGIKWKTKQYKANGKNVLFIENGLYHQNSGVYCDDHGYFSDSSIVKKRLYEREPDNYEIANLKDHTKKFLRVDYNHKYKYDPNGPILVCLQLNRDASMQNHFPLCKQSKRNDFFIKLCVNNLPPHKEVILRVHPKDSRKNTRYNIPRHWTMQNSGSFLDVAKKCSALVVVNSTCATEGLCLGIPTATFGQAAFYGANVTLDCSTNPKEVQKILDYQPEWENIDRYLCAILRCHLNFSSDWKRISKHEGVVRWLNQVVKSTRKQKNIIGNKILPKKPKVKEDLGPICDVAVIGYNGSGAKNVGKALAKSGKLGLIGIFDINDFNIKEILADKRIKKILVKRHNLLDCYIDHKMGEHSNRCNLQIDKVKSWIVEIREAVNELSDKFDLVIERDELNKDSFNDVFSKIDKSKLSYWIKNHNYRKINYEESVTNYKKFVESISESIGCGISSKRVVNNLKVCRRCKKPAIDSSSKNAKCKHCGSKNLNER